MRVENVNAHHGNCFQSRSIFEAKRGEAEVSAKKEAKLGGIFPVTSESMEEVYEEPEFPWQDLSEVLLELGKVLLVDDIYDVGKGIICDNPRCSYRQPPLDIGPHFHHWFTGSLILCAGAITKVLARLYGQWLLMIPTKS